MSEEKTELEKKIYSFFFDQAHGKLGWLGTFESQMATDFVLGVVGDEKKDLIDVLNDKKRLTRELDEIINGKEGMAIQASLVDIVSQLRPLLPDLRSDIKFFKGIMSGASDGLTVQKEEIDELKAKARKERELGNAKVYGLFMKMIQDIPKAKREAYEDDMAQLEKWGIIEPFDFGGSLETKDEEE
jgi:hypothetical protein